jgi:hypothetical protein
MNNINLKEGVTIAPFMEDVIKEVARRHPDWILSSLNHEEARNFTVFHKSDTSNPIGYIKEDYKYSNGERRRLFVVENWRISEMRQRGSGIQTSKSKEALKAVEKYFYPLTNQEYTDKAFREAHYLVQKETANTRNTLDRSLRELHQPMMTFAHKHWDEFVSMLSGDERKEALSLLQHQQLANAARALYREVDDKKCLTVYLTNGKYTVQQGEVLQEYESDTLPEHIKTKVGLLKLVENKQVVPEVGVRVDNLYVVRP